MMNGMMRRFYSAREENGGGATEENNAFELHYWFDDETHRMDALLQNKCEAEILGFIKTVATELGQDVIIETEPLVEGGLRRWFKLTPKGKVKNTDITASVITSVVTELIVTTIAGKKVNEVEVPLGKTTKKKALKEGVQVVGNTVDNNGERDILEEILQEKQLNKNSVLLKRRSNFYEYLAKYKKLTKVSFAIQNDRKESQSEEQSVEKSLFSRYILTSNKLEPLEIEGAEVEIVSPVLKKGNYKWRGIYNGTSSLFGMKSNEFKAMVQSGTVEFKNGTSIKCLLEVKRKINSEGVEVVTERNILSVNEYYNNDLTVQTVVEAKKKAKKPSANPQQLGLF